MSEPLKVLLITESVRESWMRDASTYVSTVGIIGTGVLLQSSAMQWVGAFLAMVIIASKTLATGAKYKMTTIEARKVLDELDKTRQSNSGVGE